MSQLCELLTQPTKHLHARFQDQRQWKPQGPLANYMTPEVPASNGWPGATASVAAARPLPDVSGRPASGSESREATPAGGVSQKAMDSAAVPASSHEKSVTGSQRESQDEPQANSGIADHDIPGSSVESEFSVPSSSSKSSTREVAASNYEQGSKQRRTILEKERSLLELEEGHKDRRTKPTESRAWSHSNADPSAPEGPRFSKETRAPFLHPADRHRSSLLYQPPSPEAANEQPDYSPASSQTLDHRSGADREASSASLPSQALDVYSGAHEVKPSREEELELQEVDASTGLGAFAHIESSEYAR